MAQTDWEALKTEVRQLTVEIWGDIIMYDHQALMAHKKGLDKIFDKYREVSDDTIHEEQNNRDD